MKISFFELCQKLAVEAEEIIPEVFNDLNSPEEYTFDQQIRFLHYLDQILMEYGWSKEDFLKRCRLSHRSSRK